MDNILTIKMSDFGETLGLRRQAREAKSILSDGRNILDFTGVRAVTSAFVDEFFGIPVGEHGFAWLKERVKIINTAPDVKLVIQRTLAQRLASERRPA